MGTSEQVAPTRKEVFQPMIFTANSILYTRHLKAVFFTLSYIKETYI